MLELKNITKDYVSGELVVHALKGISLTLRDHEFVSILGPSGCGKTTTLNIIGGLDRYSDGDLLIEGVSTKEYKDRDWDQYRNHKVGFVFQSYNLIPHQTVLSNVMLALTIGGIDLSKREEMAREALIKVGLESEIKKYPSQLSGGQMQRVAIARALVNKPQVMLADEPTGALDSETSVQIMELLKELSKDCLVVMVTHNEELAHTYSTRIVSLKDGEITGDSNPFDPTEEEKEASIQREKENNKQFLKPNGKMKKVGMPFLTALKLSLSNLKSKIGRTFLVCFAGSIGIIGIALVLSVSNGFNSYVDNIETSTLSAYPVEISTQTLDLTTLFLSFMTAQKEEEDIGNSDYVTPDYVMIKLLQSIADSSRTNNLKDFKEYIDNNYDKIKPYITKISYDYNVKIEAYDRYRIDENGDFYVKMMEPFTLPDDSENSYYIYSPQFGKSMLESYMRGLTIWSEVNGDHDNLISDSVKSQYNLLAGSWPTSYDEAIYVVNNNNQISDFVLYSTGLADDENGVDVGDDYVIQMFHYVNGDIDPDTGEKYTNPKEDPKYIELFKWTYEEIMEKVGFIVVPSSSYYYKDEVSYYTYTDENDVEQPLDTYSSLKKDKDKLKDYLMSDSDDKINIKITGVVMENPDSDTHSISGTIGYTSALIDKIIDINNNSDIVKYQQLHDDYLIIDIDDLKSVTGGLVGNKGNTYEETYQQLRAIAALANISETIVEQYSPEKMYDSNLRSTGYRDLTNPSTIRIYPKTFEDKDKIEEFIAEYNSTKDNDEDKISYTDYVKSLMGSVTTIINAVTYVLIAFVSISLVVSSIMIAVITYISVLERTKEIGILRAMGASKGDVKNIFNAETFITGFISGVLGVLIAVLLDIPISLIIEHLAGIKNIATLPWLGGVILVAISFILSIFSGLIPSSYAAKCDPVVALRSE